MKKFLLFVMLLSVTTMSAQDVIVKKDGSTILSKVIEIGTSEVKYKKYSNPNGPIYTIRISDILSINYETGEKEAFGNDASKREFNYIEFMNSQENNMLDNSSSSDDHTYKPLSQNRKYSLDPNDYSFYGLSYTADFDAVEDGVYGFEGNGFSSNGFGLSLNLGWNFKSSIDQSRLGPSYCVPISEKAFAFVPLQAVLNYVRVDKKEKFIFGAQLTPKIGLKFGRFVFTFGVAFAWTDGSDKIGTGFNVNLAYAPNN